MPNTRASVRRLASKRKIGNDNATSDDDEGMEGEIEMSIMDSLREARSGVKKLNTQLRSLKQENGTLKSELERAQENVNSGAGRGLSLRNRASRRQIQSLERTITTLKAAREKDKRIIEKLRDKEVERDARELADDHDGIVPIRQTADLGESAIKLLRRMCDIIDMNTLAEGEECAICMEEMAVEKCYSLPCQHPVCVECFERLGSGPDTAFDHQTGSVRCPHCREVSPREDREIITHTAVQQWDLLLDISRQWAAMDIGEMDVGEEENDEDGFIDDGSVAATENPCLTENLEETADLDTEVSTVPASSNDTGPVAYKSLPSPMKRKRLTELVALRAVKQRV